MDDCMVVTLVRCDSVVDRRCNRDEMGDLAQFEASIRAVGLPNPLSLPPTKRDLNWCSVAAVWRPIAS